MRAAHIRVMYIVLLVGRILTSVFGVCILSTMGACMCVCVFVRAHACVCVWVGTPSFHTSTSVCVCVNLCADCPLARWWAP